MPFEEKVKSMSAHDIIMAMVNGLKKEHVQVDMWTFGSVNGGICFGCAATNTICEIKGLVFSAENITSVGKRADHVNSTRNFLSDFETAIDCLRSGQTDNYNIIARILGLATIWYEEDLPSLTDHNYKNLLHHYEDLAKAQL